MAEEKNEAISFVTKKSLITFRQPLAFLIGQNVVFSTAAICEHQEENGKNGRNLPSQLTVVAMPDGRKLTRSLNVTLGYMDVAAVVELLPEDFQ